MSKWKEIRNDFLCTDDWFVRIDAWKTADDNEPGKVIAYVDFFSGRVIYVDDDARTDDLAQEKIREVASSAREWHPYSITELEEIARTLLKMSQSDVCSVHELKEAIKVSYSMLSGSTKTNMPKREEPSEAREYEVSIAVSAYYEGEKDIEDIDIGDTLEYVDELVSDEGRTCFSLRYYDTVTASSVEEAIEKAQCHFDAISENETDTYLGDLVYGDSWVDHVKDLQSGVIAA